MKYLLLTFLCSFLVFSCSVDDSEIKASNEFDIETRAAADECEPKFTEGSAYEIFGAPDIWGFEPGWEGPFEAGLFPCAVIASGEDCCPGTAVYSFDVNLPFSTICHDILTVDEQEYIYNQIQETGNSNVVTCPDGPYIMTPVAYDIVYETPLCCVYDPPCVEPYDDPCECYDDFPNDIYWGCCESYLLTVFIRYAYNGACLKTAQESP